MHTHTQKSNIKKSISLGDSTFQKFWTLFFTFPLPLLLIFLDFSYIHINLLEVILDFNNGAIFSLVSFFLLFISLF